MYEFTVQCPLCLTRLDVRDDQIGDTVGCPDCHSQITVRKPPKSQRRPTGSPETDELQLGPPIDGSISNAPMLPEGSAERRTYDTPGQDALKRAELERAASDEPALPPPSTPRNRGLLGFLLEPSTVARWIVVGLALQVEVSAIRNAIAQSALAGPMQQFTALALTVFSVVFGCFAVIGAAVSALTVLRDTANGHELITDWPAFDFVDWLLDSLYVLISFPLSLFFGAVVGMPFVLGGSGILIAALTVSCGLSVALLFPLLLLAALDGDSPIQLFTNSVWRSLHLATAVWTKFFIGSILLLALMMLAWQLRRLEFLVLDWAVSTLVAALSFVWFRSIGRLYCRSQETMARSVT